MPRHPDNMRAARPSGAGYHALAAFALGVALFATGCPADYPSCETDKDCHPKEFCVANKCQQGRLPRQPGMHRQQVQGLRERQGMPGRPALHKGDLLCEEGLQDRQRLPAG
jgi:hypothetical protein